MSISFDWLIRLQQRSTAGFMYTPGEIAFAAFRYGLSKANLEATSTLKKVDFREAISSTSAEYSDALASNLDEIDALVNASREVCLKDQRMICARN